MSDSRQLNAAEVELVEESGDGLADDFQLMLEQALIPTPNTIELERDPYLDYLHRLRFRPSSVAELFVENSKIVGAQRINQALDEDSLRRTRQWYVETAYRPQDGEFDDLPGAREGGRVAIRSLPSPLAEFVHRATHDPETTPLLYGNDLYLLTGLRSYRLMASNDWLWLDQTLTEDEADALTRALEGVEQAELEQAKVLLAFVVVPPRYTLFQGPRGYRRSLVDLGRLVERLEQQAAASGVRFVTTLDFRDAVVDEVLMLDGVERTTHAVALLRREGT